MEFLSSRPRRLGATRLSWAAAARELIGLGVALASLAVTSANWIFGDPSVRYGSRFPLGSGSCWSLVAVRPAEHGQGKDHESDPSKHERDPDDDTEDRELLSHVRDIQRGRKCRFGDPEVPSTVRDRLTAVILRPIVSVSNTSSFANECARLCRHDDATGGA